MRIVVALDSFKGMMSARRACREAAAGVRAVCPDAEVVELPMADGGEGTAAALAASCDGEMVAVPGAQGPLPEMRVDVQYAWLHESRTAVVEMAAASGLPLLRGDQKNPLLTSTFGTGEVIRHALARGCRHLMLTLGGSATVDGGTGCAAALGWRFLGASGEVLRPCGASLADIATILKPDSLALPSVEVLCDVTNPLCGPNGAAAVYGPQKGATPVMVEQLDGGLRNLAERIRDSLGVAVADMPGAGAAGGFGAGAVAFLGGTLVSGIEAVSRAAGLREVLDGCDWVITGEGRFDSQSMQGKVVDGVLAAARRAGVRVAVLAGLVEADAEETRRAGIEEVRATGELDPAAGSLPEQAARNLRTTAQRLARDLMRP